MSLSSLLVTNLMTTAGISNAGFNRIMSSHRIRQGLNHAANPNLSFAGVQKLHNDENQLRANMIKSSLLREISIVRAESTDKMIKQHLDMHA